MAAPLLKTVTRSQGNNAALKDGTVKPVGFELEFEEDGKTVANLEYSGGTLESIYSSLSDSSALNNFVETNAYYRDEIEMYEKNGLPDPWKDAIKVTNPKTGETHLHTPDTLVFATTKSKGEKIPYTIDRAGAGRNTKGYVLTLGAFHSIIWDCYLNQNARPVYEVFQEAQPESPHFSEEGES